MATLTRTGLLPATRVVKAPRSWPVRPADVVIVLTGLGLVVAGMWVRHGGLEQLGTPEGLATGLGQITALMGTYLALAQTVLMARVPWIDHVVGSDRLMAWHRWLGRVTVALIVGHVIFTTLGWSMSSGSSVLQEFLTMNEEWDLLIATAGMALLIVVALTSIAAVRRRIAYETWYGLHLYAYLGIALAFVHEAPSVVSIYLTGRNLEDLPVRAGQFFHVRFLRAGGWWRPHPFSISAAPNGEYLRMTIKDLGDDTHRMMTMPVGTPVFIEGPYGAFTAALVTRPRVVMLAGGVGVTPLRAILEDLPPGSGRATLLYREGEPSEVIFGRELSDLAARTGADIRILAGHRGTPRMPLDPLSAEQLRRLVPDIAAADVLICGSRSFTERVMRSLDRLGVPSRQIHAERFGY